MSGVGLADDYGIVPPDWTLGKELDALLASAKPHASYSSLRPHVAWLVKRLVGACQGCGDEPVDGHWGRLVIHHDHATDDCVAVLCVRCNLMEQRVGMPFAIHHWELTMVNAIETWFTHFNIILATRRRVRDWT